MRRVIFLITIGFIFLVGCDNSNEYNTYEYETNLKCSMGEVQMNGRCCRYISRYPNKDGTCPNGYDDSAPSGYNQNMCWKENCH